MAPAVKLMLALLLTCSVLLAYFGPPPRRPGDLRLRGGMLGIGMLGYVAAVAALAAGSIVPGALTLALAGELVCAAGWLSRGDPPPADDDDGGGGGGGGGRGPDEPPSTDWDAFERAFGRQVRSFEAELEIAGLDGGPVHAIFIRAPWVVEHGAGVSVLAEVEGHPVAVQQDNLLALAFHPELNGETRLHERFLELVRARVT